MEQLQKVLEDKAPWTGALLLLSTTCSTSAPKLVTNTWSLECLTEGGSTPSSTFSTTRAKYLFRKIAGKTDTPLELRNVIDDVTSHVAHSIEKQDTETKRFRFLSFLTPLICRLKSTWWAKRGPKYCSTARIRLSMCKFTETPPFALKASFPSPLPLQNSQLRHQRIYSHHHKQSDRLHYQTNRQSSL